MPFDRFLVGPINTGLQRDLKPFLIADDAFTLLQNCYVFRGRVRKRFGSIWMGEGSQALTRLRVALGNNTNAAMNLPNNTTTYTPQLAIGQMFTLSNDFFYVYQLGAGVATYNTNPAVTAVINSTVNPNTVTFTGGALTQVNWYPALPVMGLTQYEINSINNHPSYAFDQEYAYVYTNGWARSVDNGVPVRPYFNGANNNYFWMTNWTGITASSETLFVTNDFLTNTPAPLGTGLGALTDDPIWSFSQANGTNSWTPFSYSPDIIQNPGVPNLQPITVTRTTTGNNQIIANYVQQCRIILPFKNRLILLNTIENNANGATAMNGVTPATYVTSTNTAFPARCRYSHNGSPFATNAWLEQNQTYNPFAAGVVNADGGGFIDAATDEQIISAEFIKDRLIVYFERSTWELAYTGNEILPFIWQKLNTELGSQGTFSSVPFDTQVLVTGNTGIHACNGSNVDRIDQKIPDEIFNDFRTSNNATLRICGIRDYYTELVYWIFQNTDSTEFQNFANQILVYNYKTGSWALFDDCYTTFGFFEQTIDMTWASSVPISWQNANFAWNDNIVESNKRQILAGTPEGYVVIVAADEGRNAPAMQITNIVADGTGLLTLTIINHNFTANPTNYSDTDYILTENIVADAATMLFMNGTTFPIASVTDANTIVIDTFGGLLAVTYHGGGTGTRISNIQMETKWINPYFNKDRNVYLHKVDFAVTKTDAGAITVDYYPSSSGVSMLNAGETTGSLLGTSILETSPYALYPLEMDQEILWHPVYFQTTGESIQLALYFNAQQMINPNVTTCDFQLQAFILFTSMTSDRLE
jgi:hypothetical protein